MKAVQLEAIAGALSVLILFVPLFVSMIAAMGVAERRKAAQDKRIATLDLLHHSDRGSTYTYTIRSFEYVGATINVFDDRRHIPANHRSALISR